MYVCIMSQFKMMDVTGLLCGMNEDRVAKLIFACMTTAGTEICARAEGLHAE